MGVLVAAFAVFATSVPASAHDALIGSTPEFGERLDAAPSEVSLQFSDDVMTLGAAVIVADSDGHDWVVGDVGIAGNTVTVQLDGVLPDAGYELRWRVVSSDGHPISGIVPFTVGEGTPLVRSTASADGAQNGPATDATAPAQGQVDESPAGSDGSGNADGSSNADSSSGLPRPVALGIGGAAVALAVAALIAFLRRRPRAGAQVSGHDPATTSHSRDESSGNTSL